MKITIEMDDQGNVNIETNEDQIDIATTVLLLELAKMQLMGHWVASIDQGQATPEDSNEISV